MKQQNCRLEKILSFIDKCASLADIGCDHGYLSYTVLKSGLADYVYATDISEKSLLKARELLKDFPNCECVVSDGLNNVLVIPETVVISGLGGREMLKILSGQRIKTLILQPQNYIAQVRKSITQSGYRITKDETVKDNNKFYDIICAEICVGDMVLQPLDEISAMYGVFYTRKSQTLKEKILSEEKKILSYKQTEENIQKLKILSEVKKWQM